MASPVAVLSLVPAFMVLVAATIALALTGFDGLYGQDSFAYYQYATGPVRQALVQLQPLPAFFWPPGYPLLVALVSWMVGTGPLAGQLVSIIAGAGVSAFTVLLASEVVREQDTGSTRDNVERAIVPLIAGLVVAVTGQLLQSSVVVMADTLGLAAATAGAWAVARYQRTGKGWWFAIAAGAFAWAIITRWIYGLVALPFAVWALVLVARRRRRRALLHVAAAGAVAAIVLGPVLVPAVLGLHAGQNATFAGDLQVYSWNPLNALRRAFTTSDGQLSYQLPNGLYYAIAPGSWWFFGPVLAVLIVPGVWAVFRRRVSALVGVLLAWVAIVFAFHAGAPWQNPRFALAYLPPLAILVAIGFMRLRTAADPRIRRAATVVLVSGLALSAVGSVVLTDRFIERKQNDVATVRWTEQLAPPNAQLLTFGLTATFLQYSRLQTVDLSEVRSSTMKQLVGDGKPTLVLIDVSSIDGQWNGLAPSQNYRALRDGPGLIRLGTRGGYTLFEVRGAAP